MKLGGYPTPKIPKVKLPLMPKMKGSGMPRFGASNLGTGWKPGTMRPRRPAFGGKGGY